MDSQPKYDDASAAMKSAWDERAREDSRWYINTVKRGQSDEEFAASAKPDVEQFVFSDPVFTSGANLSELRLLEIGCGIGRMTQHLATVFKEVHATDVSGEMINQARTRLADFRNVHLYETNGYDVASLPDDYFDRIFCVYVFQHVPEVEVVRANIRDAARTLKPGGLFKFQTCAVTAPEFLAIPKDTWTGVSFSEVEIRRIALETGLRLVSVLYSGTQYCWTILQKHEQTRDAGISVAPARIEFWGRSADPYNKLIPNKGDYAFLTLLVDGLGKHEDANSIVVEMAGRKALPCYVGPVGSEFAAALSEIEGAMSASLIQVNVAIPDGCLAARMEVQVVSSSEVRSPAMTVELIEAQPLIPKVRLVSNAVDGGVDVYRSGKKSVFRVFVEGLNSSANPENVWVHIGGCVIKPISVAFVPANGLHMAVAEMPEQIHMGMNDVRLQFGDLTSDAVSVLIID